MQVVNYQVKNTVQSTELMKKNTEFCVNYPEVFLI